MDYLSLNFLNRQKMRGLCRNNAELEWEDPEFLDIMKGKLPKPRIYYSNTDVSSIYYNNTRSLRKSRGISRHGKQTASGSLRMISSGFPGFHCFDGYTHIFGEQVLCHPRFQTDGPFFFRLKRLYRFDRQRDRVVLVFKFPFS